MKPDAAKASTSPGVTPRRRSMRILRGSLIGLLVLALLAVGFMARRRRG